MKKLSVIIPNTDSPLIHQIIHQLKQQTVDLSWVEVLVIGSDGPGLVIEDELVRSIPTDQSASHASDKRNLGMQAAQGDIFLFIDDDCLPAPDLIEQHICRHDQGEQIVGGAVTFSTDSYLQLVDNVSAFYDLLPFTEKGLRPYLCTSNLSVNRTVVERVGKMEPGKSRAEDLEWTVRFRALGYRLYFEPHAVVFHSPNRYTLASVWRHWVDDAPHTIRVRLRYPDFLQTPALARHRWMFFFGSPFVALWATARTFGQSQTLRLYWYTIPLVYLTKLIWCWGAFRHFPKNL